MLSQNNNKSKQNIVQARHGDAYTQYRHLAEVQTTRYFTTGK